MDHAAPAPAVPTPHPGLRQPAWIGAATLAGLVMALCLVLTWQLWEAALRDAERDRRADFDTSAREVVNQLALRMAAHVQMLRGVQGLFASSDEVTRQAFTDFVRIQHTDAEYPGMKGLGYVLALSDAERGAHLARVRGGGLPDYAIAPSGTRPAYAPLMYLEPFTGARLRALGHDMFSEEPLRLMLEQARDSGQPVMSGKASVARERGDGASDGVLIALPVYIGRKAPDSIEQRRDLLRGWIYASFIMEDLIAHVGGERAAGLTLALYDGNRVTPQARMATGAPAAAAATAGLRTEQRLGIAGRRWTLVISAADSFGAGQQSEAPQLVLALGLGVTALLSLLTWMLARSSARAGRALRKSQLLADELTVGQQRLAALADSAHRAQAMMRSILDSTFDAILVDNGNRRILASNQRFRTLWSVPDALDLGSDDAAVVAHLLDQLVNAGPLLYSRSLQLAGHEEHRELLRLKDGRFIEQLTRPVRLGHEGARLWSFRDITERKQIEQRERAHRHVLELLAHGAPLQAVLGAVVLGVESTNAGMLCAILLLDAEGRFLHTGAAPSLPDFYNAAVDGLPAAPGFGSCGSAAASGQRVIVENIQTHPDWAAYREVAARAQLASSWSEPIRGASGRVLGTFAIYHRTPHYPSAANVVLIEQAAQLAGIALEQAQAAQALRVGEERFRSLYDHAPVALWEQDWSVAREEVARLQACGVNDLGGWLRERPDAARRLAALVRITDVNGAALVHVGAGAKEPGILGLAQNFGSLDSAAFIDALVALAGGALFHECESSFLRVDGVARQHELTLLVMPGHAQSLDFVIASTVDITERKRVDNELQALASTDFLTGLPNRRVFMARLDDQFARLQRSVDDCASVLMLDIDHFKRVNDVFGHAAGDAVLRHMASLMRSGQRKIDTLGRVGGEEFAVLLPGTTGLAARQYAERLRQTVAETPLHSDGREIAITVSIGIATIEAGDAGPDAALIRADKALYRAKAEGRDRVCEHADVPAPAALTKV
ncbi:diguanylate cyclase/phosphodiesterase (GGDEF & EAL domains) with PAS/PAC sensor(s) [Janthinobacterium sp. CG23_2]|nr:diguanylate cyclase/phosphodiesterase (GGDEF & EAL domains) with PAS/PAC sensor(s) [Janthinobacterium sp. CG23_2]CUU30871.1 diguanylate cyclase/phosphodiesterase (GGDEF & EAL domains) with PAS/PAC sensor(s) [Janthinobacterium sp. CG23_2]